MVIFVINVKAFLLFQTMRRASPWLEKTSGARAANDDVEHIQIKNEKPHNQWINNVFYSVSLTCVLRQAELGGADLFNNVRETTARSKPRLRERIMGSMLLRFICKRKVGMSNTRDYDVLFFTLVLCSFVWELVRIFFTRILPVWIPPCQKWDVVRPFHDNHVTLKRPHHDPDDELKSTSAHVRLVSPPINLFYLTPCNTPCYGAKLFAIWSKIFGCESALWMSVQWEDIEMRLYW